MPLLSCPDCTKVVSDQALSCPACGRVLGEVRCPKCGIVALLSRPAGVAASTRAEPLSRELLDRRDQRPQKEMIFREAIEFAQADRASGRDPLDGLRKHWRETRERMQRSVPPAARAEYESLTVLERKVRHRARAWVQPDAQRLHEAYTEHMVRASEATRVISAWYSGPGFDQHIAAFTQGELTAQELLRQADAELDAVRSGRR